MTLRGLLRGWTPPALVLACWPVVVWCVERLVDSPEERWHLVPAALLVVALWLRRSSLSLAAPGPVPWSIIVLLWGYVVVFPWLPPLLRTLWLGILLALSLSHLFWRRMVVPGILGSLLMALPALPTVHFFLGYPWRRWTTLMAAQLLNMGGLSVTAEGARLRWAGGVVAVDAPCSGLYMGWVVGLLLVAMWLFNEASWQLSLWTGGVGLGLVLVANGLRASALFYLESGVLDSSPVVLRPWHHDAVGLAVFAPLCLVLGWMVAKGDGNQGPSTSSRSPAQEPRDGTLRDILWGLALVAAALLPWWADQVPWKSSGTMGSGETFPGWPSSFEDKTLQPLPLSEREERFGNGFPGRLGRFHDGRREVLLRWVEEPTRRLHPAAQCLKAHGYTIDHHPQEEDAEGRRWSVFLAEDAQGILRIREGIRDADGRQWGDVSAWYWAALLGHSRGPWWGIVVAERETQASESI